MRWVNGDPEKIQSNQALRYDFSGSFLNCISFKNKDISGTSKVMPQVKGGPWYFPGGGAWLPQRVRQSSGRSGASPTWQASIPRSTVAFVGPGLPHRRPARLGGRCGRSCRNHRGREGQLDAGSSSPYRPQAAVSVNHRELSLRGASNPFSVDHAHEWQTVVRSLNGHSSVRR
jgi:hypothetical protein